MDASRGYDCSKCMYYMMNNKGGRTAKNKKEWFLKMNKKYGMSCGLILYYDNKPIGYAQFAPKSELIKLEDYQDGACNSDAWYIACLAILKDYHGKGFGKKLLKEVLKYLKQNEIKTVQGCGKISGDASKISSGYWSMYRKEGFKEIGRDKDIVVGELRL